MDQPDLTLLHGWGMPVRIFEPLLARLRARACTHAPPLPGYPASRWPAGLGFEREIEIMARELPAGGLLGWSLGGIYALELCRRHPGKFSSLILVACNPCFVIRDDWPCAIAARVFDDFGREIRADWRRTLRRFLALQLQGETAQRELARELWRQVTENGQPDVAALEFGLELLKTRDARPTLAALEQPAMLLLGERDRLVPIELRRQIAEIAPAIRVESIAGAAHAPFLSHPEAVAACIDLPAARTS
ncbi:MAG TPA: alpha/beta fold hydrolase [Gammaproteobacteria bacterium]|nr:alpha/beta fold hydrolase [Gammaproteobacteria bacterium]